ncbi:MAG: hypothetical protein QOJ99_4431 [Bryobacterales bacterium]|nr:hypothetical protein [Bryobacterales bacterium]
MPQAIRSHTYTEMCPAYALPVSAIGFSGSKPCNFLEPVFW